MTERKTVFDYIHEAASVKAQKKLSGIPESFFKIIFTCEDRVFQELPRNERYLCA